jgi:hypothetical protein
MAARQRKTLVVCRDCHHAIHAGRPTRQLVQAQVTGEPRETETLMRGSERGRQKSTSTSRQLAGGLLYPTVTESS